jgi:transcriptional regulator with XRE-family HTH domain
MLDITMVEQTIAAAGLTYEEAAQIMQITRNTLHHWRHGRPPRVSIQVEFAMHQIRRVRLAIDRKLLPLSAAIDPAKRLGSILNILRSL